MEIRDGRLEGSIAAPVKPTFKVTIEERDHCFFNDNGWRMRENRIYRIITDPDGTPIRDELLAHNLCRVTY